jgi:hypothetical protein
LRLLASVFVVAAFAGCAQLQATRPDAGNADAKTQPASASVVDIVIPPDALGARDPQLSEVLAKVGAVAAKQAQPTTIVVAALAQDFGYLDQAVRRGIPPQRAALVRIDNVATGSCQPYSVRVKPTE